MPYREKVIKGLETCYCPPSKCYDCPYHDLPDEQSCNDALCLDALALLKEQEAVKPEFFKSEWRCGVCSHVVLTYCFDPNKGILGKVMANYCPSCGRQVKWE